MAEVPTEEELVAARQKLADLRSDAQTSQADKEAEVAAARRQAEWDAIQKEIAYQEEAVRIMGFEGSMDPTPPEVPEEPEEDSYVEPKSGDESSDSGDQSEAPQKQPPATQPNTAGRDLSLGGASDDEKGE